MERAERDIDALTTKHSQTITQLVICITQNTDLAVEMENRKEAGKVRLRYFLVQAEERLWLVAFGTIIYQALVAAHTKNDFSIIITIKLLYSFIFLCMCSFALCLSTNLLERSGRSKSLKKECVTISDKNRS
jgi:hypothetical protein